jgi:DNA polymerase-3 subunit alpha
MTLDKALDESPPLKEAYAKDPQVKHLIDISRRLEGTTRHASIHAAGVVIAPEPLVEFVPLFKSNRRHHDPVRHEGRRAHRPPEDGLPGPAHAHPHRQLREDDRGQRGDPHRPDQIPSTTPRRTRTSPPGRTSGLFQFESDGMRDILRRFKPDRLEHLTALNALYRPGRCR